MLDKCKDVNQKIDGADPNKLETSGNNNVGGEVQPVVAAVPNNEDFELDTNKEKIKEAET